jgi:energy-converting hydrogenase Eha subunit C
MKGTRRTGLSVALTALGFVCILLAGGIFDIATAQQNPKGRCAGRCT